MILSGSTLQKLQRQKTVDNLKANKLVNLSCTNIFTTESYQLKGKVLSIKPATEEDNESIKTYIKEFDAAAAMVGFRPGLIADNLPHIPAIVIEFVVDQVFDQTPKVGTGKTVEAV